MPTPKAITDWEVSINGEDFIGKASEFNFPKPSVVEQKEWLCGNMFESSFPMGYQMEEANLKLLEWTPSVYRLFGIGFPAQGIIVKAGATDNNGVTTPIVGTIQGRFTEIGTDPLKKNTLSHMDIKIHVVRFSFLINGQPAIVFDRENNVLNMAGFDLMSSIQAALGRVGV